MAENAAPEVQEPPPRHKRSLLKLLLLALNVLLFLAGVGSLAWTKFGPKPVVSAVAQGQDQHEDQKDTAPHEPVAKGHEAPAKAPAAAKAAGGHGSGAGTKSAGGQGGSAAPSLVPLAPFLVNLSGRPGAALSAPGGAGGGPWGAVEGRARKTSARSAESLNLFAQQQNLCRHR
jgi:flagellar basal body-associated protein FliL